MEFHTGIFRNEQSQSGFFLKILLLKDHLVILVKMPEIARTERFTD